MKTNLLFSLLVILKLSFALVGISSVDAATHIEEIRSIIVHSSLWSPSFKSLEALSLDDLNVALKAIDPYARYVPPVSLSVLPTRPVSLGIEIFNYKSQLWVKPDMEGPGCRAGLPEIGKLLAINHNDVSGLELSQVSAMLDIAVRKQQVAITVSSQPSEKRKTYKVRPAYIPSPSLIWKRVGNRITIRIREFVGHDTAPRFAALYKTVVKEKSEVLIDLRGCTGGDLYESIEIAGMFVPSDFPLATTHDRAGVMQTYRAQPGQKLPRPTWLLMDHSTASAAEIFAAILNHYKLTRLVGERSMGKCVSQTILPLSNGGNLWLTTLDVRFPDGSTCTGKGLYPEILYPDVTVAKMTAIISELVKNRHKDNWGKIKN